MRYVIGKMHTNALENFCSLLKRCVKDTYIALDPQHIEGYLELETFFNNRKDNGVSDL